MSKVGILTYNFALNYGSLLQCYALQQAIADIGHDSYVVNLVENNDVAHTPLKRKLQSMLISVASKVGCFRIIRERNLKVRKFREFAENNFNYTEKCASVDDLYKLSREFDAFISGSDQVWNTRLQDFTEMFFLPVEKVKKIGYSISTGPIEEHELRLYADDIREFDSFSVREKRTSDIIKAIIGKEPVITCDPVFLIDRAVWDKIADLSKCDISDPYLLVFLFGKNREYFDRKYEIVNRIAKEKNLKVYYLNHGYYKHSFRDNAICDAGIEDFIKLIRGADAIITDSFHGTAFSIIYEKDFFTYVISKSKDKRKQEMLKRIGVESRCIEIDNSNCMLDFNEIDYHKAGSELKNLKDKSIKYLVEALS